MCVLKGTCVLVYRITVLFPKLYNLYQEHDFDCVQIWMKYLDHADLQTSHSCKIQNKPCLGCKFYVPHRKFPGYISYVSAQISRFDTGIFRNPIQIPQPCSNLTETIWKGWTFEPHHSTYALGILGMLRELQKDYLPFELKSRIIQAMQDIYAVKRDPPPSQTTHNLEISSRDTAKEREGIGGKS